MLARSALPRFRKHHCYVASSTQTNQVSQVCVQAPMNLRAHGIAEDYAASVCLWLLGCT